MRAQGRFQDLSKTVGGGAAGRQGNRLRESKEPEFVPLSEWLEIFRNKLMTDLA